MFLLLVNLYEFGQFLRILLWISVPMFIVAMLVTTWLHYRRRRKTQDEMALSMEGLDLSAPPEILIAAMNRMSASPRLAGEHAPASNTSPAPASDAASMLTLDAASMPASDTSPTLTGAGDSRVVGDSGLTALGSGLAMGEGTEPAVEGERETIAPADAVDNMYKGILWMKSKYEQYRELADQRIEQLKEQVAKVEKKYEDLLVGRADQRIETVHTVQDESLLQQQLEAKDRQIEALQTQLQVQYLKTEELVAKLQNSSQLLVNLSQELDKTTLPPQPQA
jgi:hypothetical protein